MHLCINTKLSLPWDDSSDSFYTNDSDPDDGSMANHPQDVTPPIHHVIDNQQIGLNPYTTTTQQPSRPTILTTLRSWILPNQNQPPTVPIQTMVPTQIEILTKTNQNHLPIQPQLYQTILNTPTNNNHWGDKMILPKPQHTFRVLSRNVNTLSTQQNYIQ